MTKAVSKPSQQQANNFHVLPKDKPTPAAPANTDAGHAAISDRDPEAGSVVSTGGSQDQLNQSTRTADQGRSQVS